MSSSKLFADGWTFAALTLVLYLLGWLLEISPNTLREIFTAWNVLLIIFFVVFLFEQLHRLSLTDILFWFALTFLVFFLPGTYLEFPADNWEHFRRILSWQSATSIHEHELRGKFSYFWAWTWISLLPLHSQRFALDFLNSAQQLFVALPIYFLGLRFFADRHRAQAAVLVFIFTWGTSIFGLRYYGLSSSLLAYGSFLYASLLVLEVTENLPRVSLATCGKFAALLGLIFFNHLQEGLLFGVFVSGVLLLVLFRKASLSWQRRFFTLLVVFCVASIPLGMLLRTVTPGLYANVDKSLLSAVGNLDIAFASTRYFSTLGAHGILALGFSVLFFRRLFPVSLLSLMPTLWLLCPLTFALLANVLPAQAPFYRLLYAFPLGFALYGGLLLVGEKLKLSRQRQTGLALLAAIALAIPAQAPWFGRARFAFHQPSSVRSLENLETTAAWLQTQRSLDPRCYFIADGPTSFALISFLGRDLYVDRLHPSLETKRFSNPDRLVDLVTSSQRRACGIFLLDETKLQPAGESWAATASKHWKPGIGDARWYYSEEFIIAVQDLLTRNFSKTFVPPHYWYFEPITVPSDSLVHSDETQSSQTLKPVQER